MGTEQMNQENSINATIKELFNIETIPGVDPTLLRENKLTKEGALQLFLYAPFIDWKYHASLNHDTGDKKIDAILNWTYVYFTNPTYISDEYDLSAPSLEIYNHIRSRLSATSASTELLRDSHKKANDIL